MSYFLEVVENAHVNFPMSDLLSIEALLRTASPARQAKHRAHQSPLHRLPNDAKTRHQAVALFLGKNPVNSLQRTSDHFHLHAFLEIQMRMAGQQTHHTPIVL